MSEENSFAGFAVLELMGHRRLAGWVEEATLAGAAFLRLDVPEHESAVCTCGSTDPGSLSHEDHTHRCMLFAAEGERPVDVVATQFYAPAAVYCITPTTERIARGLAVRNRPVPVMRWELPAPPESRVEIADDGPGGLEIRDDDDCECGHFRSAHLSIEGDAEGQIVAWGACGDPECDCESFDMQIPF